MNKVFRFVLLFAVCIVGFSMSGCGKDDSEDTKYTADELMKTVTASITDLPSMTTINQDSDNAKDIFTYLSTMDYDKIKDFAFNYATDGTAEEIAIVCVKDSDDADTIEEDLNKRLSSRKATFETYNEEELAKFDGATVVSNGNYIMLIIGNQAQNGKFAFNKAFE